MVEQGLCKLKRAGSNPAPGTNLESVMKEIHDHKINPVNDRLIITAIDEPGSGGANHQYDVEVKNKEEEYDLLCHVPFQNGPIDEAGINGVTHEALLAIIADRLRSFQAGPYASRENAVALTKIEEAMMWLHKRTLDRMRRGVEGTSKI